MPFNLDSALGFHADALKVYAKRSEVLAANMANADTPQFKAQDIDFKTALNKASQVAFAMKATQPGHLGASTTSTEFPVHDVKASQSSLDGNTVDTQAEAAKFTDNALRYQANLEFLNGKISSLRLAIRGDG